MLKTDVVPLIDASADFCAGWISGCAGVLVSHPFDTIKVRLQTQGVAHSRSTHYTGTWHCLTETIRREKIRGLFKGISSPLLGTALWNAVVFGSYGNTIRHLSEGKLHHQHEMKNIFIASLATGAAQTVVICPLELTKTRLQIQSCDYSTLYKGLIDCTRKILKEDGVRGLFKGFSGTLYRDLIGFPVYFCSFELLCRLLSSGNAPYLDLGAIQLAIAGGIAGSLSWTAAFPSDVIKCRTQVDYGGRYKNFSHCLRTSFEGEGVMIFKFGLLPTVLRAFPMNAAIFSIYTISMRWYNERMFGVEIYDCLLDT